MDRGTLTGDQALAKPSRDATAASPRDATAASPGKSAGQPVSHPFPPVWAADSRILILGTMPSRQSRKQGFYYGHPQNRFWKMLGALLDDPVPAQPDERRDYLRRHHIALWDVLQSCAIRGSQDSTIQAAVANDIAGLLAKCPVRAILTNGQSAGYFYRQLCEPLTGRPCQILPSTSPANGRYSLAALCDAWRLALSPLTDFSGERPPYR
jgi:hypoxanthine-DNA glycosylase